MLWQKLLGTQSIGPVYFAALGSVTNTIILPSGLSSKDLLVLFDLAVNTNSVIPTAVVPSGWTQIENATGSFGTTGRSRCITTRIAGSPSLSGTSVTGMAGATNRKLCIVFRNVGFSSVGTNSFGISDTIVSGSLTAGTSPYIALAFVAGSGVASVPSSPAGLRSSATGAFSALYGFDIGAGSYSTNDSGTFTALKLLTLNISII